MRPIARGLWLCAVVALDASCRQTPTTLAIDVSMDPPSLAASSITLDVSQGGHSVLMRRFSWDPAHAKLGLFMPDGVTGQVQIVGKGFDGNEGLIAMGQASGTVVPGAVSNTAMLTLTTTTMTSGDGGAVDGATNDGGPADGGDDTGADAALTFDGPDDPASDRDGGGAADLPSDLDVPDDLPSDGPDGPGGDGGSDSPEVRPFGIFQTADFGHYCSITDDNTGQWQVGHSLAPNSDPCRDLTLFGRTGHVQAGLLSSDSYNNVMVRCDSDQAHWAAVHIGETPFNAIQVSINQSSPFHQSCIFVAAPLALPIFGSPIQGAPPIEHRSGVDFARRPYGSLNLAADFGQPGASMNATVVDSMAKDRSGAGFIDDHDGHDWNIPSGTPILAVADGIVLGARFRDVTRACDSRTSDLQGEVFISHVVHAGTRDKPLPLYDESFVSYYAHLSTLWVNEGQQVRQGDVIGQSGDTGCETGAHLHFGVYRLSNTSHDWHFDFKVNTNFDQGQDQASSNGANVMIDPYCFISLGTYSGWDPWALRAYPAGALSLALWMPGAAPPLGDW